MQATRTKLVTGRLKRGTFFCIVALIPVVGIGGLAFWLTRGTEANGWPHYEQLCERYLVEPPKFGFAPSDPPDAFFLRALGDNRMRRRGLAAVCLSQRGYHGREIVVRLIEALEDESAAGVATSSLLQAFRHKVLAPRDHLALVPALSKALKTKNHAIRLQIVEQLWQLDPLTRDLVASLGEAIDAGPQPVRLRAEQLLAKMGPGARDAVPSLIRALAVDKGFMVDETATALARIGPDAEGAVPALVNVVRGNKEFWNRAAAAYALGQIGKRTDKVIEVLNSALLDGDMEVRAEAAEALWRIDPKNQKSLAVFLAVLEADIHRASVGAVRGLATMGKEAESAIPVLVSLLDKNDQIRPCAAYALWKISPQDERSTEAFIKAIAHMPRTSDEYGPVFHWLRESTAAKKALPALVAAVETDEHFAFRREAAQALARFGANSVPTLMKLLKNWDEDVQRAAAVSLGEIGPEAESAIPALEEMLQAREHVREAAANALTKIDLSRGIVALLQALSDEHPHARWNAVRALGQLGSKAKVAVPYLRSTLSDSDDVVRKAAAQTLALIENPSQGSQP